MIVPFGFSVGDFIAGLGIIRKAIQALQDTGGAKAEYEDTIKWLESLEGILHKLLSLQNSEVDTKYLDALRFLVEQRRTPINTFRNEIEAAVPMLGLQPGKNHGSRGKIFEKGRAGAQKVRWAIQLKKHLVELRASVGRQLDAIDIILSLISL